MTPTTNLADLRRGSVPGKKDLRAWQFREKWSLNDTTTVLAWADDHGCVVHEHTCGSRPAGPPTLASRMDEARQLFAIEQPMGTVRYFGFCGNCLTEKIPNYGWTPTPRDVKLRAILRMILNDLRLLGGRPISKAELVKRMNRYGETVNARELKRLMVYDEQARSDEDPDLAAFVAL